MIVAMIGTCLPDSVLEQFSDNPDIDNELFTEFAVQSFLRRLPGNHRSARADTPCSGVNNTGLIVPELAEQITVGGANDTARIYRGDGCV